MKHTANENANKPSFIRARIYSPMYGKKMARAQQEHTKPNQNRTEPYSAIPKRNETSEMLVGKGENWQKDANEPNSLFVAFNTFNSVYFSFLQHTNFAWHGMALSHPCTLYTVQAHIERVHFISYNSWAAAAAVTEEPCNENTLTYLSLNRWHIIHFYIHQNYMLLQFARKDTKRCSNGRINDLN